eukprot:gene12488-15699_t
MGGPTGQSRYLEMEKIAQLPSPKLCLSPGPQFTNSPSPESSPSLTKSTRDCHREVHIGSNSLNLAGAPRLQKPESSRCTQAPTADGKELLQAVLNHAGLPEVNALFLSSALAWLKPTLTLFAELGGSYFGGAVSGFQEPSGVSDAICAALLLMLHTQIPAYKLTLKLACILQANTDSKGAISAYKLMLKLACILQTNTDSKGEVDAVNNHQGAGDAKR